MEWHNIRSKHMTPWIAMILCLCGIILIGACGGMVEKAETIRIPRDGYSIRITSKPGKTTIRDAQVEVMEERGFPFNVILARYTGYDDVKERKVTAGDTLIIILGRRNEDEIRARYGEERVKRDTVFLALDK